MSAKQTPFKPVKPLEVGRINPGHHSRGDYGVIDLPLDPREKDNVADLDKLKISSYYEGLAEFISGCVTPMTIAVQGPWGSGKTSALFSIERLLDGPVGHSRPNPEVFYINTWQYSVLDSGSTLVTAVLERIVADFVSHTNADCANTPEDNPYLQKIRKATKATSRLIGDILLQSSAQWVKSYGVSVTPDMLKSAVSEYLSTESEERAGESVGASTSTADTVVDLRTEFAELIESYCRLKNIDKVVFLIDDLDRLEPARAVELMEVFKILLDVPQTVFILAVDFDIVKLGVRQKYSAEFMMEGSSDFGEWKARSFFDKIVQVPFNMPVSSYEPAALVEQQLGQFSSSLRNKDELVEQFCAAARYSVGTNPRAIKRLFNAFTLTNLIAGFDSSDPNFAGMFFLIALEVAYPEAYLALVKALDDADPDEDDTTLESLLENQDEIGDHQFKDWRISDSQRRAFIAFLREISRVFTDSQNEEVNYERLQHCVRLSSMTSVNAESTTRESNPGFATIEEKLLAKNFTEANLSKAKILELAPMLKQPSDDFPQGVTIAPQPDPRTDLYHAYMQADFEYINAPKRGRPKKFLSLYQNTRALLVAFGDDRREHWVGVPARLEEVGIPLLDAKAPTAEFGYKTDQKRGPFLIQGITTDEQVAKVRKIAPYIYRLAGS